MASLYCICLVHRRLYVEIAEKLSTKSRKEVDDYWAVVGVDQKKVFDYVIRHRSLCESGGYGPDEFPDADGQRNSSRRPTNHHKKIRVDSYRDRMRKVVISTKFQVFMAIVTIADIGTSVYAK